MAIVGYARVSTGQQDYEGQVERLNAAGAERVYSEKRSGLDGDRPELARCLEFVREGDTLIVTKLDRLARSMTHFYKVVEMLRDKGVSFKVLDDSGVDTSTRTGKLVMGILSAIAEFETSIRKERQMEGIKRAKAKAEAEGKPYARRPRLVTEEVRANILKLRGEGMSIRSIAKEIKLSKATVQKVVPVGARP